MGYRNLCLTIDNCSNNNTANGSKQNNLFINHLYKSQTAPTAGSNTI